MNARMREAIRLRNIFTSLIALSCLSTNAWGQASQDSPEVAVIWGEIGTGRGQFREPQGVATDGGGNVYVVDTRNHRIQKFTDQGVFLLTWGSIGSGEGEFWHPAGITVDMEDDVYVADSYNHRMQKFTSNGIFITQWGTLFSVGDSADPSDEGIGQFYHPSGVAVDSKGDVYVTDSVSFPSW